MRRVLLSLAASLAAIVIPAAPVQAEGHHGDRHSDRNLGAFVSGPGGFAAARFSDFCDVRGHRRHDRGDDGDRHDRRDRDRDRGCFFADGSLGYLDPGDYDANRSFDPDLWNDWWHERPERAFPRWVRHNQDCTPDRMWWSGSGWHC